MTQGKAAAQGHPFCGACGQQVAKDARFCGACGAAVVQPAERPIWLQPPWLIGAGVLVLIAAFTIAIVAQPSGKWGDMDPALVAAMGPQMKPELVCEALKSDAVPYGFWVILGQEAHMAPTEVQQQTYDFCGLPIPAYDSGLETATELDTGS